MDVVRGILGGASHAAPSMTPEQLRLRAEQRRIADQLRLLRIDAGIPDRRRQFIAVHPHRRRTDRT